MTIPKLKFHQNILICIILSLLQVFIINKAISIYIPFLFTLVFSFSYGLLEPRKGWMLAIIQVLIIVLGFWCLKSLGISPIKPYEAEFATYACIFPSFVVSFFGSFLFKTR